MIPDRLTHLAVLAAALALAGCETPPAKAPAATAPPAAAPARAPAMAAPAPSRPATAAPQPAPSSIGMLETILKRLASDKGVSITRTSTGALLLRATGDTSFNTGSAALSPSFMDFLRQLANGLQTYSNLSMKVTGHTDNTGDAQLNDKLSEARAAATINFLVKEGVPASRMLSEGKGQSDPIASNDTAEGRASNRRVDMLIIELPKQ
ncbi:OmpA family protein [Piscinibacter sakaiensis]|uniref:OmpA family protein n=1 Tax=Piscinibacter sakaiensis TaxID=1547922 RepID=UPI003AAAD26C